MSYLEPKELIRAKNLLDEGKLEEALQLVNEFGKKKDLSSHERIYYYNVRSSLAYYFLDKNECVKYAEKAYQESQNLENSLLLLDVYLQMTSSLLFSSRIIEASEFNKKCENLLEILPQELTTELRKRKASLLIDKSFIHLEKGNLEMAKELMEEALVIKKEFDRKSEIANVLQHLGRISWQAGDLNRALECIEASIILFTELNLTSWLYNCYIQFGIIYGLKGELDESLNYNEQALVFAEKVNNLELMPYIYNNIGIIYYQKGDYDNALKFLEKGITIAEEYGSNPTKFAVVDSLFLVSINMNDLEKAQRYLNQMKQIDEEEKKKINRFSIWYNINRALYLKNSPRALNRGKAEEILKEMIEEGIPEFEALTRALLNLCDLLLYELHATSESEILNELQDYISQLLDTVKNSRSYSLLAETYLLQARLSLIIFDMTKARQFLTKAQEIADKYGLNRLAIKISNEHDDLLRKLDVWDNLKESKAPLSERIQVANLNEQIERMIQNQEIVVPEPSDEEPILILIISEGGTPIFSQSFIKDQTFEDYLFGGFFTAINTFFSQKFSQGLDRAIFGEHTLLMSSVSPFFMCYVFRGQSYLAQQRINFFIEELQGDKDAWQIFRDSYLSNKEIQISDIPSLEQLITKIFIDKSVPLIA